MNYTIRKANQDDMSDVLSLIKELALFEKEPDEVEICLLYTSPSPRDDT